ncbi:hypothetical protein GCM10011390_34910 [Aureimonas endophytica]|uniref:Uncharacterized protein n=1 Tax=Aureimonas endophytica TaxID=2027858 RepID=A0A917E7K1_9HYPH|nr:hypothetical protein [Aureimonas endophytica]GGE12742.1 hypothetical protein GCM10011390_34910 [Aureimonas endophytica]
MKNLFGPDIASVLYLAYALPQLREVSKEAADLLEATILECAVSLSGSQNHPEEQLDLATFLSYALRDVETITPVGVNLLRQAIGSLGSVRHDGVERQSFLH